MWVLCIFSPVYVQSHVMALQQQEVVPPEICQPSYMGPLYRPLPSVSWIQPQRNPMVMQPRLHQVIGGDYMTPQQYPHPQLLQAHPHSYSAVFDHAVQGYRPVQYTHQMVPQGQQQMYLQSMNPGAQQYHPSQLQAMLAARQLTPQHQGVAYGSMMHQPHTLGPLPQYPSVPMHQPPSLKTTGSPQVFRHQIPTYRPEYAVCWEILARVLTWQFANFGLNHQIKSSPILYASPTGSHMGMASWPVHHTCTHVYTILTSDHSSRKK